MDKNPEDKNMTASNVKDVIPACHDSADETKNTICTEEPKESLENENKTIFADSGTRDDCDSDTYTSINESEDRVQGCTKKMKNRFSALIDSESEEEEDHLLSIENRNVEELSRKSTQSKPKGKNAPMRATKKEAMRQIHSETQRLLRETDISLPYHRPKQRTIQEFLNRKKILESLPSAPTMSAKVKKSSLIVKKILEEKEKEAELFYKSSDSEDEILEETATISDITDKERKSSTDESIKLSENKINNLEKNTNKSTSSMLHDNIVDVHNQKEQQKIERENKLRRASVPRRLFNTDCEDGGTIHKDYNMCTVKNTGLANNIQKKNDEVAIEADSIFSDTMKQDIESNALKVNGERNNSQFGNIEESDMNSPQLLMAERSCELDLNHQTDGDNNTNSVKISVENQLRRSESIDIFDTPHVQNKNEVSTLKHKDQVDMNHSLECTNEQNQHGKEINLDVRKDNKKENSQNVPHTSVLKINDEYAKIIRQSLGVGVNEQDEYNEYGLPPPTLDDTVSATKMKKILPQILNFKPQLKGEPGIIIDLSEDSKVNKKDVNNLMNRFQLKTSGFNKHIDDALDVEPVLLGETTVNHVPVKKAATHKVLSTVTKDSKLSKPGAKLIRLKEELKHQMALKRNEEWKQKEEEIKAHEKEWYEYDSQEDNLSIAESLELEDSECEESEKDGACGRKRKKKPKCPFLDVCEDDGMDECDDDDESDEYYENDELDKNEANCGNVENGVSDESDENDEIDESERDEISDIDAEKDSTYNNIDISKAKRRFKRVVRPLEDDSDVDDVSVKDSENETNHIEESPLIRAIRDNHVFEEHVDNGTLSTDNENNMPASQQCIRKEITYQACLTPRAKTNSFDFISPVTQLTALNVCLDSDNKEAVQHTPFSFFSETDSISIENTPNEKSCNQGRNLREEVVLQKKLFDDINDVIPNDGVLQSCSKNFASVKDSNLHLTKESNLSESQLLDLCSGTFSTQCDTEKDIEINNEPTKNEISQDKKSLMDGTMSSLVKNITDVKKQSSTAKSWENFHVVFSDDEDTTVGVRKRKKRVKKKVKKLNLSDDEDEITPTTSSEEQNDLDDEEKYIDYDSEENEVVVVPNKDIKKYAAKFLEEEAELSESDWEGSADEDEQDLDTFDVEEGDDEDIDDNEVKNELDKIHMRQMLDEDQRNVRLLKEMLFEDGDLHTDGSGRERTFKWRNINKMNNDDDNIRREDNGGYIDSSGDEQNEDEVKLRKMRYEREKFLAERKKDIDSDIENDLNSSKIFRFGMKCVKKAKTEISQNQATPTEIVDTMESARAPRSVCEILSNSNMDSRSRVIHSALLKHSFLAKSEASLARIATLAKKQKDSSVVKTNARNFFFTSISPSMNGETTVDKKNETKQELNLSNKRQKKKSPYSTSRSAKRIKRSANSTKEETH